MEDPRLGNFFNRISSDKEPDIEELSFKLILSNLKYLFLKEFEITAPYTEQIRKRYDGFVQLHWPYGKEGITGLFINFNEFPGFEDLITTQRYLSDNVGVAAKVLAQGVRDAGIKEFFKLELSKGCCGTLWNPPIRLVWNYFIETDSYVARFDIIGRIE